MIKQHCSSCARCYFRPVQSGKQRPWLLFSSPSHHDGASSPFVLRMDRTALFFISVFWVNCKLQQWPLLFSYEIQSDGIHWPIETIMNHSFWNWSWPSLCWTIWLNLFCVSAKSESCFCTSSPFSDAQFIFHFYLASACQWLEDDQYNSNKALLPSMIPDVEPRIVPALREP
jgi:hypothetical protein